MRILAVSDVVDPVLDDRFDAARWQQAGVELLVSCGDVPPDYLTTLASRFHVPVMYVLGNHDGRYHHEPPEGCTCIDGRLLRWRGLRILGLGGAPLHNGGTEQYSEGAMRRRALRLRLGLWRAGGVDVVVTHAPPRFVAMGGLPVTAARGSVGDGREVSPARTFADRGQGWADPGHRGFQAFAKLVDRYRPALLLHGHTHLSYGTADREYRITETRIVDVYGHYLLDV